MRCCLISKTDVIKKFNEDFRKDPGKVNINNSITF